MILINNINLRCSFFSRIDKVIIEGVKNNLDVEGMFDAFKEYLQEIDCKYRYEYKNEVVDLDGEELKELLEIQFYKKLINSDFIPTDEKLKYGINKYKSVEEALVDYINEITKLIDELVKNSSKNSMLIRSTKDYIKTLNKTLIKIQ